MTGGEGNSTKQSRTGSGLKNHLISNRAAIAIGLHSHTALTKPQTPLRKEFVYAQH
jgi:hypothetical protein